MTERPAPMNGAESVLRSLHADGVEACFANPGTSEMQFVDALDRTRLMRCVLGLFEGVVSAAADGYGDPGFSITAEGLVVLQGSVKGVVGEVVRWA